MRSSRESSVDIRSPLAKRPRHSDCANFLPPSATIAAHRHPTLDLTACAARMSRTTGQNWRRPAAQVRTSRQRIPREFVAGLRAVTTRAATSPHSPKPPRYFPPSIYDVPQAARKSLDEIKIAPQATRANRWRVGLRPSHSPAGGSSGKNGRKLVVRTFSIVT